VGGCAPGGDAQRGGRAPGGELLWEQRRAAGDELPGARSGARAIPRGDSCGAATAAHIAGIWWPPSGTRIPAESGKAGVPEGPASSRASAGEVWPASARRRRRGGTGLRARRRWRCGRPPRAAAGVEEPASVRGAAGGVAGLRAQPLERRNRPPRAATVEVGHRHRRGGAASARADTGEDGPGRPPTSVLLLMPMCIVDHTTICHI
jgi:hypothetical protein